VAGDAEPGGDPWGDKPDPWQEADQRWERWGEDEEAPAASLPRRGPRTDPDNAAEAYARGMVEAGPYLGLGLQIAGAMALFTGGGYLLDRWLGTRPWGMILGAALAFVGIMTLVVRLGRAETTGNRGGRGGRGNQGRPGRQA
jgi:F0F1-type ATP synthase assembly protein I